MSSSSDDCDVVENCECDKEEYTIIYYGLSGEMNETKIQINPYNSIAYLKSEILSNLSIPYTDRSEIFLMYEKCVTLTSEGIFQEILSACEDDKITDYNLKSFLENLHIPNTSTQDDQESNKLLCTSSNTTYEKLCIYNKIVSWGYNNTPNIMKQPMGVDFNTYLPYCPNRLMNLSPNDGATSKPSKSKRIIDYGNIYKNKIHAYKYNQEEMNVIYFPNHKETENTRTTQQSIMPNVVEKKKKSMNISDYIIKLFSFTVPPKYPVYIDLKNLFHTINADKDIPYIKFVYGSSLEKSKNKETGGTENKGTFEVKSYCEYFDHSYNKIPLFDPKVLNNVKQSTNKDEVQFFIPFTDKEGFDLCYIITSEGEQKIYAFMRKSKKLKKNSSTDINICSEINNINKLVKLKCTNVYNKSMKYLKSIGQFGMQSLDNIEVFDDNVQMDKLVLKPKVKKNGEKNNIIISRRVCRKRNCIFMSNNIENKTVSSNNMNIMNWLCSVQYNYTYNDGNDEDDDKDEDEEEDEDEDISSNDGDDSSSEDESSEEESSGDDEGDDGDDDIDFGMDGGNTSRRFIVSSIKVINQEGAFNVGDCLIMEGIHTKNDNNDKNENVKIDVVDSILNGNGKLIQADDALFASVQKGCDYKELYIEDKDKNKYSSKSTTIIKLYVNEDTKSKCFARAEIVVQSKSDSFSSKLKDDTLLLKQYSTNCPNFQNQPYTTIYGKNIFDITDTNEVIRIHDKQLLRITRGEGNNYTFTSVTVINNTVLEQPTTVVTEWDNSGYFMFFCGHTKVNKTHTKPTILYAKATYKDSKSSLYFCGVSKKHVNEGVKKTANSQYGKQLKLDGDGPSNNETREIIDETNKKIINLLNPKEGKNVYSIKGKENNTFKACMDHIFNCIKEGEKNSFVAKTNISLIDKMKEYIDKNDNKNFLNLQNGDLFTIFSRLQMDNIDKIKKDSNTIENVKKNYIKYIEDNDNDMSYNYVWDLMEKVMQIKIIIIESDNIVCPNILYNTSLDHDSTSNNGETINSYLILKLVKKNGTRFYNISTNTKGVKKSDCDLLKFVIKKNVLQSLLIECVPTIKKDNTIIKPFVLKELKSRIKSKNLTKSRYYMSPISHKVIGVDVKKKEKNLFIPCYPSSVPLNDNIDSTYDLPPTNELDDIIDVVEELGMKIQCSVINKETKDIIGLFVTSWDLFIPCVGKRLESISNSTISKKNININNICSTSYTSGDHPYKFDISLTNADNYDTRRINETMNILTESRMYSKYRVAMKIALNCLTGCTENSIEILGKRTSILHSVIEYLNKNETNNSNKINDRSGYKTSMPAISKILESIYDSSVETVDGDATELNKQELNNSIFSDDEDEDISREDIDISTEDEDISTGINLIFTERDNDSESAAEDISRSGISSNRIENAANILSTQQGGTLDKNIKIYVTEYNLLSSNNKIKNKDLYTHKLADELLRYPRIRSFILGPDSSIPFQVVPLTLNKNEEIFDSDESYQKAYTKEKYIRIGENYNTTFDTVRKI